MFHFILLAILIYFSAEFLVFLSAMVSEHRELTGSVIRLHVVADSDETEAQDLKLKVRDRITGLLSREMEGIHGKDEAETYLKENLPRIRQEAETVLRGEGCGDRLKVTLMKERFGRRDYDTFSLPAGRYESLRITIGRGAGHNWWCVVFPSLCIPASAREFEDCAQVSGMDPETIRTLEQDGRLYALRFGILDAIGELENTFFSK